MPGTRTPRPSESRRAAFYARVSDRSQAEEDKTSLAEQIGDMEAYCEDEIAAHHFLGVARGEVARARVDVPLWVSQGALLESEGPLGREWTTVSTRSPDVFAGAAGGPSPLPVRPAARQ